MSRSLRLWFVFTLLSMLFVGCQSTKRATPVDEENRTATIRLSGIEDDDRSRANLIYELADCVDAKTAGTLKPDGRVAFVGKNLKASQTCSMTIKSLEAASDSRFKWVDGKAGTLYAAADIVLRTDIDGTVVGTAALSKNYQIKTSNFFTVSLSGTFPEEVTDDPKFTAEMSCRPALQAVSVMRKDGAQTGTFEFEEPLSIGEERKYSCSLVAVWVNQSLKYRGVFGTGGAAISFTGKPGNQLKPVPDSITFQKINLDPTQNSDQIIVNTVEGSCAEGELFDIIAGKCKKP